MGLTRPQLLGRNCDWQANAEYGLEPNKFDSVYYDAGCIQLVNYYNTDERWAGWILNDEVRATGTGIISIFRT